LQAWTANAGVSAGAVTRPNRTCLSSTYLPIVLPSRIRNRAVTRPPISPPLLITIHDINLPSMPRHCQPQPLVATCMVYAGYYPAGGPPKSNQQAQVDMIEQVLDWAGVTSVNSVRHHGTITSSSGRQAHHLLIYSECCRGSATSSAAEEIHFQNVDALKRNRAVCVSGGVSCGVRSLSAAAERDVQHLPKSPCITGKLFADGVPIVVWFSMLCCCHDN